MPTLDLETDLLAGAGLLLALDEVGRGCLAGPASLGAVLLDAAALRREVPDGLADSKLLTESRRAALEPEIEAWVGSFAVESASVAEIDELGIAMALGLAASRAVAGALGFPGPEQLAALLPRCVVLLDGNLDYLTRCVQAGHGPLPLAPEVVLRTKADRDCASVAAASVLAKQARDRYMSQLDALLPGYRFAAHKGYGTPEHLAALESRGSSCAHRQSFTHPGGPMEQLSLLD